HSIRLLIATPRSVISAHFPCHTLLPHSPSSSVFFLFTDPSPPSIYTLSLHDALPIYQVLHNILKMKIIIFIQVPLEKSCHPLCLDRKSTRLNSSHVSISYAVFCLKKKKNNNLLQQMKEDVYQ